MPKSNNRAEKASDKPVRIISRKTLPRVIPARGMAIKKGAAPSMPMLMVEPGCASPGTRVPSNSTRISPGTTASVSTPSTLGATMSSWASMERLARNSLPGPGEDQDDEVEDGEEHITEQLRRLYRQPPPPATAGSWSRRQFELLCQFRAVFWLAAYAKAFRVPVASRAASIEINESGRDNRSAGHFYCQLSNVLVPEVTAAWPEDEPDFFVPHVLENHLFSPCKSRLRRYAAEPVHRERRPSCQSFRDFLYTDAVRVQYPLPRRRK